MVSFLLVFLCRVVEFSSQGLVESQGKPLDVGSYAAPLMVDWNDDGLLDLLAGQFEYGRIRFYANQGTNEIPVFNEFQYLRDGGGLLSVPSG
jgi:hypothetical protein